MNVHRALAMPTVDRYGFMALAAATSKSLVVTLGAIAAPPAILAVTGFRLDLSLPSSIGIVGLSVTGWLAGLAYARHLLGAELRRIVDEARQRKPVQLGAWS